MYIPFEQETILKRFLLLKPCRENLLKEQNIQVLNRPSFHCDLLVIFILHFPDWNWFCLASYLKRKQQEISFGITA